MVPVWVTKEKRRSVGQGVGLDPWLTSGGLHRLELGHRVNNPASRGVALAAGFVQEGVEREKFLIDGQRIDVVTYGRLASDPTPRTEPLPIAAVPNIE